MMMVSISKCDENYPVSVVMVVKKEDSVSAELLNETAC